MTASTRRREFSPALASLMFAAFKVGLVIEERQTILPMQETNRATLNNDSGAATVTSCPGPLSSTEGVNFDAA